MKKYLKYTLLPFLLCLLFTFCAKKASPEKELSKNILYFEYDSIKKGIILDGMLNDSIPMQFFYDTGFTSNKGLIISDSLRNTLTDSLYKVKINDVEQLYKIHFASDSYFLFQHFSQNTAFLELGFFEDKIVKISYKQKYIQTLDSISEAEEYICLPLKREENCPTCLGVETEVFLQGKHIREYLLLDTGFNGFASFNDNIIEKYSINTDSAQRIQSLNTSHRKYQLLADSIKAGYPISDGQKVEFLAKGDHERYPYSGLLGNAFLENFEIIFDFKDYKMYIKP